MSDQEKQQGEIRDEFRRLGQNLKAVFQGAWESEERIQLQQDLENGLNELGITIREALDDLENSETGQKIKADVQDLQERARTGELEEKARSEIQHALDLANRELEKLTERWKTKDDSE